MKCMSIAYTNYLTCYIYTYENCVPKKRFYWIYKGHEIQLAEEEMFFLEEFA